MKASLLIVLALVLPSSVVAIPAQTNHCKEKEAKIIHPYKNHGAVFFDDQCSTAYVAPPTTGKVTIVSYFQPISLAACPGIVGLQTKIEKEDSSLNELIHEIGLLKDNLPSAKEVRDLRSQIAVAAPELELAKTNVARAQAGAENLRNMWMDAKQNYKRCLESSDENIVQCEQTKVETKNLHDEWKRFLKDTLYPTEDFYNEAQRKLTTLERKLKSANEDYEDVLRPLQSLHERLVAVVNNAQLTYAKYANLEGITAQVLYELAWTDLVELYRQKNINSDLSWIKLPFSSARITWSTKLGISGVVDSLPALISATIPGMKIEATLPNGKARIEKLTESPATFNESNMIVGGGDSFSGQIVLSLGGSCALFPKGFDEQGYQKLDASRLASFLTVNSYYQYPVKVQRHYAIEYNLEKLVERMEKMSSKGGFFSASNIHSLAQNTDSKDWLNIDYGTDDISMNYSAEERAHLTNEIKLEVIDRVVRAIAAPSDAQAPSMPEQPKETLAGGNTFTLHGMFGCTGLSICYAKNWILLGLESIFGSKNAVSDFKQNHRGWGKETARGAQVVERTHVVTFVP